MLYSVFASYIICSSCKTPHVDQPKATYNARNSSDVRAYHRRGSWHTAAVPPRKDGSGQRHKVWPALIIHLRFNAQLFQWGLLPMNLHYVHMQNRKFRHKQAKKKDFMRYISVQQALVHVCVMKVNSRTCALQTMKHVPRLL